MIATTWSQGKGFGSGGRRLPPSALPRPGRAAGAFARRTGPGYMSGMTTARVPVVWLVGMLRPSTTEFMELI